MSQGELARLPGPLWAWSFVLCPKAPDYGPEGPWVSLGLGFLAGIGLGYRDFLKRKRKGHILGGQAVGNSWQSWPLSSGHRTRLGAVMEGVG